MTRFGYSLTILVGASLGLAACSGDITTPNPSGGDDDGTVSTTGSDGTTFDHENDTISVWDLINRINQEGPPAFTAHMHGCTRPTYTTLGHILTSIGVNLGSTTALSAADLYKNGQSAISVANYASRARENVAITTSGASRIEDIFVAAASEVIQNLPNVARCQVGGVGPAVFDASNNLNPDAVACMTGVPAQQSHIDYAKLAVTGATNTQNGQRIAVAAILAAAFTCN